MHFKHENDTMVAVGHALCRVCNHFETDVCNLLVTVCAINSSSC